MPKPPALLGVYRYLGTQGSLYLLSEIGDELAIHSHDFMHISLILSGEVEITGDAADGVTRHAVSTVRFPANVSHGIRALTPGVTFINVTPSPTSSSNT